MARVDVIVFSQPETETGKCRRLGPAGATLVVCTAPAGRDKATATDFSMNQGVNQPRTGMNPKSGLMRLVSATGFSLTGLAAAWRSEAAFRQEVVLAALMLPGAFWLGTNAVERVLLAGTVLLVLIVELLNTAIEYTVDRIGTERHDLAGRAKDMGSAAVLLSLVLVLLTWGTIGFGRIAGGG